MIDLIDNLKTGIQPCCLMLNYKAKLCKTCCPFSAIQCMVLTLPWNRYLLAQHDYNHSLTWHLTFISLSCICSMILFLSHFSQAFFRILHFIVLYMFQDSVLSNIFHKALISNTLLQYLSHLVFFVAIYINVVICLPYS